MRVRGMLVAAAAIGVVAAVGWRRRRSQAQRGGAQSTGEPTLLPLLACPHCRGLLTGDGQGFVCPVCARTYPVRDGIVHFIEAAELSGQNRRFAHLYDWFSWVYAPSMRASFALIGMTERTGRNQVLDRLTPRGGRVLEVSVGSGPNLPFLLDRPDVGEVHGLDISIGQLRRCRALVRRHGWYVPLYLATAEALPFAENSFDTVLHVGGINFFNDKARAIAEMVRVAKPGAHIVIVDENERAAQAYERTLPGFKKSFATERPAVSAPMEAVPPGMKNVEVSDLWRGWFYCLEFDTPRSSVDPSTRT
jgi:ubiquinone/menaquinone biosynthesis C-methylase UbiE